MSNEIAIRAPVEEVGYVKGAVAMSTLDNHHVSLLRLEKGDTLKLSGLAGMALGQDFSVLITDMSPCPNSDKHTNIVWCIV